MKDKKMALKDTNKVFDAFITLQKKVEREGPFPPLGEYVDYISIWSESRYLRGKNFYAARAANIRTDVEFIIRYRTDIDESMKIKYKDKLYEIEGILPIDNSRMFLSLKAHEIKNDM